MGWIGELLLRMILGIIVLLILDSVCCIFSVVPAFDAEWDTKWFSLGLRKLDSGGGCSASTPKAESSKVLMAVGSWCCVLLIFFLQIEAALVVSGVDDADEEEEEEEEQDDDGEDEDKEKDEDEDADEDEEDDVVTVMMMRRMW